jgi:hypothetical protein
MSEIWRTILSRSVLAFFLEHLFELVAGIEVVFDGALAASGDDDDLVASGGQRFFDAVLNDGLVDQRKHFLGLGFGGGQEASAEAGGGEHGFANSAHAATVMENAAILVMALRL